MAKTRRKLTARGKALRHLSRRWGITEQGHNTDRRKQGIRWMQERIAKWAVGKAWCGAAFASALKAAGVKGVSWRQLSVAYIEDDAKARRAPFGRGWLVTRDPDVIAKRVLRGDGVVLFGYGRHVEQFRELVYKNGRWLIVTSGGNTSPQGGKGSQAEGDGLHRRERELHEVRGFALVNFPG
jgi:hypothetical protein